MEKRETPEIFDRLRENLGNIGERIQDGVNNGVGNINQTIENTKEKVNTVLDDFSSKSAGNTDSEFLSSNSIIAKFAFIILVLILFVFLFNLGVRLISYFTLPTKSPYIVRGVMSGSSGIVVTQNPQSSSSITLQRSNNNKSGIEFTWSVWLNVSGLNSSGRKYSHVFNKGDSKWGSDGLSSVNNGPGLYLVKPDSPNNTEIGLYVVMDTGNVDNRPENSKQVINITAVPLQKWFNVCICVKNVIMDVYVNGVNSGRVIMPYVPRQNYNDINVCQNGGFVGDLSDLRYYDHALSIFEINGVTWKGPNLMQKENGTTFSKGTNYVSNLWYTSKW
jgi:hypothetical protein